MKLQLMLLLCSLIASPAATITVTNIGSPSSSSTVLTVGNRMQMKVGLVAIGSFSISDEAIKTTGATDVRAILNGFNQLGDAFQVGFFRNSGLYLNTVTALIQCFASEGMSEMG